MYPRPVCNVQILTQISTYSHEKEPYPVQNKTRALSIIVIMHLHYQSSYFNSSPIHAQPLIQPYTPRGLLLKHCEYSKHRRS